MGPQALRFLASAAIAAGALWGQQASDQLAFYNVAICTKVVPGKSVDHGQYVSDLRKLTQARADAGELVSWSLLRSVIPAGDESCCDYVSLTTYKGMPGPPTSREDLAAGLSKAGFKISADEYIARRSAVSRLVSIEMWRPLISVGESRKGHYLYVNFMKVHKMADYVKFEREVWKPMAEQWTKEGAQSGWGFSVAMLPAGTDVKYAALSADIYPSWEAVFKTRSLSTMFNKVHAGKNYDELVGQMGKLRDLARRELLVVEEKVTPAKK